MKKIAFQKLENPKQSLAEFKQKKLSFTLLTSFILLGILALASFLGKISPTELVWLTIAGIILVLAYSSRFATPEQINNAKDAGQALVIAFIVAGLAIFASNLLFFVATLVAAIGAMMLFGGILAFVFVVLVLLSQLLFLVPLILYLGITALIFLLIVKLFSSDPEPSINSPHGELNIDLEKLEKKHDSSWKSQK